MVREIQTEDRLEYTFFPLNHGSLRFRVKAANDAHVALTTGPSESEPIYEIFLGGWGNTKSALRRDRQKPDKAEAETPNVVTADEEREFWIKWNDGTIQVGHGGQASPFLEYADPDPFPIGHYGVRTGWGATGQWVVEEGDEAGSAPVVSSAFTSGQWVDTVGGEIPSGAFVGGQDHDCDLFIGRASHNDALIPGKVNPNHKVCYVPWGGEEHGKEEYQVLCGTDLEWISSTGSDIPAGALPGGNTEDGEVLYVGRVPHEGTITIGKVHPSHGVCYIPYGGSELGFPDYEVLVSRSG
ncbi:C3 and PZP-like alpha-2-macroglobulin domain-containing protein 8 isoform X2 [Ischnura elegans]|uniref:C3 and PZP-like alpha-2-macroglobulin domain-containing protein 8 isoform X2 n=1 Tax=Ischnura elegans TaxID=197161 RepID=UPI001ED8B511|nr:C3 and PZP-like alpha-2-macroglobulin domain-containing protein 8 isoform X2 [Ischnura elegans]